MNFLGLKRWAYSGSDSFATAYATRITIRGDLQVVLIMKDIHNHATGRNPNKRRTSGVFYRASQITLHHCIQGWSGIAEWGGLPMSELIDIVRPLPDAKAVIF